MNHSHSFILDSSRNEKNTRRVVALTALMMVAEIAGGAIFNSLALMADGFHMGTHAFALGITLLAYWYARRNVNNPVFTFGTGKVHDLGGYTSAIVLLVVALIMAVESFERFLNPLSIRYTEAMIIAAVGLAVNLLSAWILRDDHTHEHEDHEHAHRSGTQDRAYHDHNIKAAYLHVLADALTSILAIAALALGMLFGWVWMDPLMGIVGAVVIARWSFGLLRETSAVLLDKGNDSELVGQVRAALEDGGRARVIDLHLWQIGPGRHAVAVSLLAQDGQNAASYRLLLARFSNIVHATIEVEEVEAGKPEPA